MSEPDPITTGGHHPQDKTPGDPVVGGYEPINTSVRNVTKWLFILGAVIVGSLMACFLILWEMTDLQQSPASPAASARTRLDRAAPRLKYDSPAPRLELRRRETELLTTSGWVDREAGVARISIDDAMEIVAKRAAGRQKKNESNERRGATDATE